MALNRVKVALIVLLGLGFLAGPMTPRDVMAQAPGVDKALNDAAAAQERAAKAYTDLTTRMNSVKNMPNMDENEKSLVATMQQMTETIKMLLDANKITIDALKEVRHMQK